MCFFSQFLNCIVYLQCKESNIYPKIKINTECNVVLMWELYDTQPSLIKFLHLIVKIILMCGKEQYIIAGSKGTYT